MYKISDVLSENSDIVHAFPHLTDKCFKNE